MLIGQDISYSLLLQTSTFADVGWIDGGIVSVLILDRYTTSTVQTITPTVSSLTDESNKNHINIPLSNSLG